MERDDRGEPRPEPEGRDERPDLTEGDPVEHLWNAAHEMLRAFRTLIDAADEFVESQREGRPAARAGSESREGRVHHINIDDDTDDRIDDRIAGRSAEAPGTGSGVA